MSIVNRYNLAIVIQESRRGNAIKGLKGDVAGARREINGYNGAAKNAGAQTGRLESRASRLGAAIKRALIPAFLIATAAITKWSVDSVREFAQFEKKLQEVFTLMPDASREFKESLGGDVRFLNQEYGKLSDETLPALYQALSAGVSQENAIEAVATATEAAIAGVADLDDTMKTGMAIVNAYAGEVYDLEEAYDILFQLIRFGVVTMNELNSSLSNVISIAAESQTPFEDIAAALIVMTRQGDSASEATELLGLLLQQLGTDGTAAFKVFKEANGIGFRDFIAEGNGLVDALIIMQNHANETGQSLSAMISGDSPFYRDTQAARASLELTGDHLDELVEQLKNVKNNAGAMSEAFGIASDNTQFKLDQASSSLAELKLLTGETILERNVIFGLGTGTDLIEGATAVLRMMTGFYDTTIEKQLEAHEITKKTMPETILLLNALVEAYTLPDRGGLAGALGRGPLAAGLEQTAEHLANLSSDYEQFISLMQTVEATDLVRYDVGDDGEAEKIFKILGTNIELTEAYFDQVRALRATADATALAKQRNDDYVQSMLTMFDTVSRPHGVSGAQTKLPTPGRVFQPDQPISDELFGAFDDGDKLKGLTNSLNEYGDMLLWVDVQTTTLSASTLTYISSISDHARTLQEGWELLQEAGGEWITGMTDNSEEASGIMAELAGDISSEQRDAVWDSLSELEEGGAEWLAAWDQLQGDLTQTQRFELVKQLADFEATHGEMVGIWNGDVEAAEEASRLIQEALQGMATAYLQLGTDIAENAIAARFGEDSVEAQRMINDFNLATGQIDAGAHQLIDDQITKAQQLDVILAEMWTAYLASGDVSAVEMDNIAIAMETIAKNTEEQTIPQLKEMIGVAIDSETGFPKIGGILIQIADEDLPAVQTGADDFVAGGPYAGEFEVDDEQYYEDLDELIRRAEEATGPYTIKFKIEVEGNIPTGGSIGGPDEEGAHGLRNFVVPGGFPNDTFTLGLTSGERVNVETSGQQSRSRGGKGYQDNRNFNVIINNHTRAAAQLAQAQLDALAMSRANDFMGG